MLVLRSRYLYFTSRVLCNLYSLLLLLLLLLLYSHVDCILLPRLRLHFYSTVAFAACILYFAFPIVIAFRVYIYMFASVSIFCFLNCTFALATYTFQRLLCVLPDNTPTRGALVTPPTTVFFPTSLVLQGTAKLME